MSDENVSNLISVLEHTQLANEEYNWSSLLNLTPGMIDVGINNMPTMPLSDSLDCK